MGPGQRLREQEGERKARVLAGGSKTEETNEDERARIRGGTGGRDREGSSSLVRVRLPLSSPLAPSSLRGTCAPQDLEVQSPPRFRSRNVHLYEVRASLARRDAGAPRVLSTTASLPSAVPTEIIEHPVGTSGCDDADNRHCLHRLRPAIFRTRVAGDTRGHRRTGGAAGFSSETGNKRAEIMRYRSV